MTNPYRGKPGYQFWRSSVANLAPLDVDPVAASGFKISPTDRIATAGSCFAQHIARTLSASGYNYMVAEDKPATAGAEDENYGTFSARYGNLYTVRQLLQLFRRAYATFEPNEQPWTRNDGCLIDPFRPAIQAGGFADKAALDADRDAHLAAVRDMFETCDVFIFTLGLTEAWVSNSDGAVFPLAPGTVAPSVDPETYYFHNFTVGEMEADLSQFIDYFRRINPSAKIILTVSPVPLIATYEPRHVLVSTTYSKAALRVVADQISRRYDHVEYFPSYEMITGPHSRGAYFAEDLREVLPDGVKYVMRIFSNNYLSDEVAPSVASIRPLSNAAERTEAQRVASISQIICDEELIESSL